VDAYTTKVSAAPIGGSSVSSPVRNNITLWHVWKSARQGSSQEDIGWKEDLLLITEVIPRVMHELILYAKIGTVSHCRRTMVEERRGSCSQLHTYSKPCYGVSKKLIEHTVVHEYSVVHNRSKAFHCHSVSSQNYYFQLPQFRNDPYMSVIGTFGSGVS
jgi:hypothetical protein